MKVSIFKSKYSLVLLAFCGSMATSAYGFGGFYAGADLGLGYSSSEHDYSDLTGKGKTNETAFGAVYGGHAGYLYEIGTSKTIVGGEIYGNIASMNPTYKFGVDNLPVQGEVKIKRSNAIGLGLIAGKMFNIKTMVYGKMAFERATFDYEYKFRPTSILVQYRGKTVKRSITEMGPVIGLGLAYKPTRMFIVGAEYQFGGAFPKKKVFNEANIVTEFSPVEHRLLLKVSFAFG